MKKNLLFLIFAFSFLLPATIRAAGNKEAKKVIGIIALPPLCYWTCEGYDEPLPLYYEPDADATPATFLLHEDIENWPEFAEYEYEEAGALVYDTRENWYLISRNNEFLWAHRKNQDDYHPYPQILRNRLTFYAGSGTKIWNKPSETAEEIKIRHLLKTETNGLPVKITGMKKFNDEWWVKVEILSDFPCGNGGKTTIQTGWMPAYNKENERQFWFYSRGC